LKQFAAGTGGSEWVVIAVVVAIVLLLIWFWGGLRVDTGTATSRLALRRKLVHRRARA
jgi:uncharacterized membrane protein YqiK